MPVWSLREELVAKRASGTEKVLPVAVSPVGRFTLAGGGNQCVP